jgi:hypothetical protein
VPDKPTWLLELPYAIKMLRGLEIPWIPRSTVQNVLNVGPRRAQQIIKPIATHQIGTSYVVDREALIRRLEHLATSDTAVYEQERRQRFSKLFSRMKAQETSQPKLMVEVPVKAFSSRIDNLPEGVRLAPGQILIEGFSTVEQAIEKLVALAMAAGNDPVSFQEAIEPSSEE